VPVTELGERVGADRLLVGHSAEIELSGGGADYVEGRLEGLEQLDSRSSR